MKWASGSGVDADCVRYLTEVVGILADVLGPGLVGTYLHGSAVFGGFDARRSDLDVLAVCRGHIRPDVRASIGERLVASGARCPAAGLEFSLVTERVVRHPAASPAFELHVMTAPPQQAEVIDGTGREGDPDLVLHVAACRAAGRVLDDGPPPARLFAPVPRDLVLTQLGAELAWAVEESPDEYAVLNACRAWRYAVDGPLVSKVDGGEWALSRCGREDADLVRAALARQRGSAVPLDRERAVAFAERVAGVLRASRGA